MFAEIAAAGQQLTIEVITTPTALGWMRTKLQGHHWQESTQIGHFQASKAVIVEPGFPAKNLSAKSKNRSTTVPSLLSRHQFQRALDEYSY